MAALTISLFVAGIPVEFALLQIPCPTPVCTTGQLPPAGLQALGDLGLTPSHYAAYTVAMDILFAVVYAAVAGLIFWRRSDDGLGLFVSLALLTFGTATFGFTAGSLASGHSAWEIPVAALHFVGAASFGLFLYVFPDGRFMPRWTRWAALAWISWQLAEHLFPDWVTDPNFGLTLIEIAVWLGALGTVVYSQAYRYKHTASFVQRQQIKWVVFGISAAFAGFLAIDLALSAFAAAPEPSSPNELIAYLVGYTFLSYLIVLLIPVTIGIAMLRYHLFDVDLVINRTLVYATLTASVVAIYAVVVGGLGTLLQARGNFLVSLLAAGLRRRHGNSAGSPRRRGVGLDARAGGRAWRDVRDPGSPCRRYPRARPPPSARGRTRERGFAGRSHVADGTRGRIMNPLRVLIADDHPLFRAGLGAMLASAPDTELVGEATTGSEAVSLAAELGPDVVVMDVQMPQTDGIEATRRISREGPNTNILVVTMFEDDGTVFQAMRAGAKGYILKGANYAETLRAIRAVGNGEAIFSPQIAVRLVNFLPRYSPPPFPRRSRNSAKGSVRSSTSSPRASRTPRSPTGSSSAPRRSATKSPPYFTSSRLPTGRRPSSGPGRRAWGEQKRPPEESGGRTLLSVTQVSRLFSTSAFTTKEAEK